MIQGYGSRYRHFSVRAEKEADRVAGIAEPLVTGSETSFSMSQEQEDRAYELKRELGRAITRSRSEVDAMPADQIGKLGGFWLKLGELSGISRFPKHLPGKSVGEIIENFGDPNITVGKDDKNGEFSFAEIHSPTGIAYVFEDANGVWVNTAGANGEDAYLDPTQTKKGSVGAPAYQIAQAYARNIGKKFVDDEMGGVSEVARFRRWPQMLSSAIRYGSTSHLDATKDVSRWTDGQDPAFDAGLLAMHEAVLVEKYIPEIKNFRLSEDMSKIVDANGAEVSQDRKSVV